jgi:dTDP-4-dehydrorhamnose 3,5-epimerase-like enzyme
VTTDVTTTPSTIPPRRTTIADCRIIDLPRIHDQRGNLTFIEGGRHLPFEIARVFYLYDVPGGEARAGHAHVGLEQLIVAASGSFRVVIDDAEERKPVFLNRSYQGLYLPPMIWRELEDFSSGSVCLVLASKPYHPDDYFRDYDVFQKAAMGS